MTTPERVARPASAVAAMTVVLGVFVARPLLTGTAAMMALFALLLVVGAAWPGGPVVTALPGLFWGDKLHSQQQVGSQERTGRRLPGCSEETNCSPSNRLDPKNDEERGAALFPRDRWIPRATFGHVDALPSPGRGQVATTLVVGLAGFLAARLVLGGHQAGPLRGSYLAEIVVAAVAEEAFFRRFVYGVLRPGGTALAVAGSAALFALAHVTVYGWWVLPLDLAAGLVLSWQRWASGSWAVPALTHVAANLLVVL